MRHRLRDKPAGTVRITCGGNVLHSSLLPKLAPLLREYPDIKLEFDMNYGFRDIVADRFDAGVRLGNTVDKDMIAVPSARHCAWRWWLHRITSRGSPCPRRRRT